MNGWFDNDGFNTFYLNSSKYTKKNDLLADFYLAWYNEFGKGLSVAPNMTYFIKDNWKSPVKNKIKTLLQGRGYTSASIDGLLKKFSQWNKSAPM